MTDDPDYVSPGDEAVVGVENQANEWEEHFHRWWLENIGNLNRALIKATCMIPVSPPSQEFVHSMYLRGLDGAREHQSGLDRIPNNELISEINAEAKDLVIYLLEYMRRQKKGLL